MLLAEVALVAALVVAALVVAVVGTFAAAAVVVVEVVGYDDHCWELVVNCSRHAVVDVADEGADFVVVEAVVAVAVAVVVGAVVEPIPSRVAG